MVSKDEHIISTTDKVISIRDLYKSFGTLNVLRGIDLDVYRGENVVVLGRSGTGKFKIYEFKCNNNEIFINEVEGPLEVNSMKAL